MYGDKENFPRPITNLILKQMENYVLLKVPNFMQVRFACTRVPQNFCEGYLSIK